MKFRQKLTLLLLPTENDDFLKQSVEENVNKVIIKILPGSVVSQAVLDGLTVHPVVATTTTAAITYLFPTLWKMSNNDIITKQQWKANREATRPNELVAYAIKVA